jgi:hypothetical protein
MTEVLDLRYPGEWPEDDRLRIGNRNTFREILPIEQTGEFSVQ